MILEMNMQDIIENINDMECALYSVVLREGKITRTECFLKKDDVIAYLFDKDIGMWSVEKYDIQTIAGMVYGLKHFSISLYRNLK